MKIGDLLNYIQENIDDDCLNLDSEVCIIDEWADIHSVDYITNDANELTLATFEPN